MIINWPILNNVLGQDLMARTHLYTGFTGQVAVGMIILATLQMMRSDSSEIDVTRSAQGQLMIGRSDSTEADITRSIALEADITRTSNNEVDR